MNCHHKGFLYGYATLFTEIVGICHHLRLGINSIPFRFACDDASWGCRPLGFVKLRGFWGEEEEDNEE